MAKVTVTGKLDLKVPAMQEGAKAMRRKLFEAKPLIETALRNEVRNAFKVKNRAFPSAFRGFISYRDKSRPPVAVFKWVIPWVSVHATGGAIQPGKGKFMLIPVNTRGDRRMRKDVFRDFIRDQYHNLTWHPLPGGKYLLTYERHRDEHHGIKRFRLTRDGKRNIDVPVAFAIPRVSIKKRIDADQMAKGIAAPILRRIFDGGSVR
jgi:hypothetical protein